MGKLHAWDIPLLANVQPSGKWLGEKFHRAGGVHSIMWELWKAGELEENCLSVNGKFLKDNLIGRETNDRSVIYKWEKPIKYRSGFITLSGNLFDFAIMKTSVISKDFHREYLSTA